MEFNSEIRRDITDGDLLFMVRDQYQFDELFTELAYSSDVR